MVKFRCPDCGFEKEMDDSAAGKKARCPKCNVASAVSSLPPTQVADDLTQDVKAIRRYLRSIWLVVVIAPTIIIGGALVFGFLYFVTKPTGEANWKGAAVVKPADPPADPPRP